MKRIITLLAAAFASFMCLAQTLPYQDPTLSPEERAKDLVSRLSLEQKVSLMMNRSAAVPEFGIRRYNWWNEALHGAARNGLATVFPQAIGMAASWDPELLEEVFDIASTEQRIKYVQSLGTEREGNIYCGLTCWTPNINIFRDPRWGRGQETYGEDPYLTAVMGKAVVMGLQGDSTATYDKLHACLKHYAVHSGPESSRHTFDVSTLSYRDLMETYLYAFEWIIRRTDVQEVMCAYQRFEGKPCCGSDKLLTQILRRDFGYRGLVVSDCGAINDFSRPGAHEVFPGDPAGAAANAVLSGTDLECGSDYRHLIEAVEQGKIKESDIDVSLVRLFKARFRLGEMDPVEMCEWNKIPQSVLACDEHRAKALKMARESMTLLQNRGNVLPLAKDAKIAVLGPNAADTLVLWGNYNGFPRKSTSALQGIIDKIGAEQVIYAKGCEIVSGADSMDEDGRRNAEKAVYGFGGEERFSPEALADVDAIVFVGGISPDLEGEEMYVGLEGFNGGDRTDIELPRSQREFLSELSKTGKPIILVNMSGSAIALEPETKTCDAILQAWYGGEMGGVAIADVLFGDYNPAGHLPVSFYAKSEDLPDFEDYDMAGRTYRYFDGKPLFAFGHGLSYSNFDYGKAKMRRNGRLSRRFRKGDAIEITVPVKNVSPIDGEETVQIYIRKAGDSKGPRYALRGFRRQAIAAGESAEVKISLDESNFRCFNEMSGKMETTPGKYVIYYGPSSDPATLRTMKVKCRK